MKMNFPMKLYMVECSLSNWFRDRLWAPLLLILLGSVGALAQSGGDVFPPKPDPVVHVHDYSGWLSESERGMLEEKLRQYEDSTSTQIVVMIRPDLGDYDKSSYAFELGNRWGIGRKSTNNGVVMLIKSEPPDRGIFIATGYGTEGALPDITAGQIIRNTMGPYFRQKQYYQGINAGLDDIIHALSGEFTTDAGGEESGGGGWIFLAIFICVIILFIFIMVKASKSGTLLNGGGRHHGGGWGGGFGGGGWGGGSSWGGGGGSSWGGGGGGSSFGGGSFGGGGAGGDW